MNWKRLNSDFLNKSLVTWNLKHGTRRIFSIIKMFSIIVLNGFLLNSCANQSYPSGGPVDTEAPHIVEMEPKPNTLNYKSNRFHFEFNEYIERRSFEDAVFISPANVVKPQFEWSGKEVDVILPYDLKENKTYSLTIGTDVVDINNRNRMAESYTLAFSTGDKIDSFSIAGKVYDGNTSGILISAYKIDSINSDTLNPAKSFPDYTTQTGKEGDFKLRNLGAGTYRIFALQDEYKNLVYDPMLDRAGLFWEDISLNDKKVFVSGLVIKLAMFDTTSLKMFEAEARNNQNVLVKFSRNIDISSFSLSGFSIADSATDRELSIKDYYIKEGQHNQIRLFTDSMRETKYILSTKNIKDSSGQYVDSAYNKYIFMGSLQKDTLKPVVSSLSIKDSAQNYCSSDPITFSLNTIVDTSILKKHLCLTGSGENKKFDLLIENNSVFSIIPKNLSFNTWYKLYLPKAAVTGTNGLTMDKDSIEINFKTEERSSLTSISGSVSDSSYIIESTSDKNVKYRTKAKKDKSFKFDRIKDGKYTLFLFRDTDNNNVYSYGNPYPYKRPEKFFYFSDTLKVKAKWPLEDVKIIIP